MLFRLLHQRLCYLVILLATARLVPAQEQDFSKVEMRTTRLADGGSITREVPAVEAAALPQVTFDHELTVHLNGDDVRAVHYPNAHSDGDSIVFFPHAMLKDTTAAVAGALKAGKTLAQMKQERILGRWSERYSPPKAFVDTDAFTETLYNSLRGHTARHGGPRR